MEPFDTNSFTSDNSSSVYSSVSAGVSMVTQRSLTTHPKPTKDDTADAPTMMRVRKRNGDFESVDLNKIVRAVGRSCQGLTQVDALRVATKTISGIYDGATTSELDKLSIQTAAALIVEEPEYSRLAARLLSTYVDKEVADRKSVV